jgi:hypothetical protein
LIIIFNFPSCVTIPSLALSEGKTVEVSVLARDRDKVANQVVSTLKLAIDTSKKEIVGTAVDCLQVAFDSIQSQH